MIDLAKEIDLVEHLEVDLKMTKGNPNEKLPQTLRELKAGLAIDVENLSDMVVRQPVDYQRAREFSVFTSGLRDKAKRDLELIAGEVYLEVRASKEAAGTKFTEALLTAEVKKAEKHIAAQDTLFLINRIAAEASGLAEAYIQRMWMLRELITLYGSAYQAGMPKEEDYEKDLAAHREARAPGAPK